MIRSVFSVLLFAGILCLIAACSDSPEGYSRFLTDPDFSELELFESDHASFPVYKPEDWIAEPNQPFHIAQLMNTIPPANHVHTFTSPDGERQIVFIEWQPSERPVSRWMQSQSNIRNREGENIFSHLHYSMPSSEIDILIYEGANSVLFTGHIQSELTDVLMGIIIMAPLEHGKSSHRLFYNLLGASSVSG